ncbi:structural maintenance of chromosomes protein 5 isoform X2 [Drosophila obscura]|uniref:structural maintenance of chromosomes protein 5 isoform X2 n=1 Tax=Drosophila obscura TaxID=7282 RepID=UPI001BB15EB8|nr:structural maintenance of chromosomes protein 5 isoform X2 [Drosophila obscura]
MQQETPLSQEKLVGRIKSVYVKNFVSYNEVTYCPKLYLNVLTGPNGSGKSTIVSAIMIGLGAEPTLLDRSASIADYIQSGAAEATIVVTIYGRLENTTEAFRRVITSDGSSSFYVKDVKQTKKNFQSIVASYNLQVGNLCQFMPQDRVQDFSKMNPQELLSNTIASICDNDLTNNFSLLREMRSKQNWSAGDREKQKIKLQKKQHRLEQLKFSVEQFREGEEINRKVNILKIMKIWLEVQKTSEKAAELKQQLETEKMNCKKEEISYNKHKQAAEQIEKKRADLRNACLNAIRSLNQSEVAKNVIIGELDNLKQEMLHNRSAYVHEEKRITQSVAEAEKVKLLIDAKNQELTELNKNKSEMMAELENHKESFNNINKKAMDQLNKRRKLESALNDEKIPEITALKNKMERLKNVKTQKKQELSRTQPNLVAAMNWVDQNRHKYKLKIYDPMIFELSIESDDAAKYLENVVRQRDLFAFACEDKGDMSDLINELCVKQKLDVNIIHCAPADTCSYSPTVSRSTLRPLGFHSYLVDLVTGPAPIINKLCSSYSIHNIPIGTDAVSNHTSSIPKQIRVYFGGNKKFMITTSRYRPDLMLTESSIQGKNQLIAVDTQQLEALQRQYSEVVVQRDRLRNAITLLDSDFERLQANRKEIAEKKQTVEHKLSYVNQIKGEIENLLKKFQRLNETSNSLDSIKKQACDTLLINMKKMLDAEERLVKNSEQIGKCLCEMILTKAMEAVHMQQQESQTDSLKNMEEMLRSSKRKVNQLSELYEGQTRENQKKICEIKLRCNNLLPTDSTFPFKNEFHNMESMDINEVREAINDHQARFECIQNKNSDTIKDFNELQNEAKSLEELIQVSSHNVKTIETEMSALYEKWKPKLNDLIGTINIKFGEFMESIDYVGEINLSESDPYDFDTYGIQILVQFRKNTPLQTLDKFIQSGGERAVSIAVYSLALQHVTHVPFRCVDEINQGMDAKNERNIFNLLLREATKPGSAQYLFVTPKLLCDLEYNEKLCVAVVYNSQTVSENLKFPSIAPMDN